MPGGQRPAKEPTLTKRERLDGAGDRGVAQGNMGQDSQEGQEMLTPPGWAPDPTANPQGAAGTSTGTSAGPQ